MDNGAACPLSVLSRDVAFLPAFLFRFGSRDFVSVSFLAVFRPRAMAFSDAQQP